MPFCSEFSLRLVPLHQVYALLLPLLRGVLKGEALLLSKALLLQECVDYSRVGTWAPKPSPWAILRRSSVVD